jgi:hypothetical protein
MNFEENISGAKLNKYFKKEKEKEVLHPWHWRFFILFES